MGLLVGLFLLLHAVKIAMIFFLEKRGGDAREFIGSDQLVTEGVYKYSRNPAYVISIAQSVIWSLVLLRGGLAAQPEPVSITVAIIVPILHFLSIDRWIIPNEEKALRARIPRPSRNILAGSIAGSGGGPPKTEPRADLRNWRRIKLFCENFQSGVERHILGKRRRFT